MFTLICLNTYNQRGIYTVKLGSTNTAIEINPTINGSSVYFSHSDKSTYSAPTLSFSFLDKGYMYKTNGYSNSAFLFKYPHIKISLASNYDTVKFNIYILEEGLCQYSYLTYGNTEFEVKPYSSTNVCVFTQNLPDSVELTSSYSSITYYAIESNYVFDYSKKIKSFNGPTVLVSKFSSGYTTCKYSIYDSTDRSISGSCGYHQFQILTDSGFISQAYFSGTVYSTCYGNSSSGSRSRNTFLIMFACMFSFTIFVSIFCCYFVYRKRVSHVRDSNLSQQLQEPLNSSFYQQQQGQLIDYPDPQMQYLQGNKNQYQPQQVMNPYQGAQQPFPPMNNSPYAPPPVSTQDQLVNPYSNVNSVY
ncbi:hypothetical protein TVAG_271620 [Trichomonas vaginalis G3]|uniref:Transmembrane protein n=1 Tax=Trichomonas vaginalis (strain ATCC PRA-98 / G3) TaxID=412133 RepID=A2E5Q9_TRIV3|nr:hypothetical protein TVAGG3_0257380 [Trichomonas vaginalis G3]EAY11979.1 hypothetical protein TVAG_271620 [Trichomonas vaginalis G3]KAI5524856.1 hypothetical protein TVAGG3_0257380 [Trichomonas vaginalis G3]|eukprot:XP_001324202.1 hypothetical protein [Trichomonas vaginalis G3]